MNEQTKRNLRLMPSPDPLFHQEPELSRRINWGVRLLSLTVLIELAAVAAGLSRIAYLVGARALDYVHPGWIVDAVIIVTALAAIAFGKRR